MNTEILLELGRVVYVNYGPDAGRIGVVVDIVNGNKVIVDGPSMGITRKAISVKRLELTKFRVPGVTVKDSTGSLKKKIDETNVLKKFNETGLGKKL